MLEINQTCAVQTGCFAGDTAGLPVTIATAGSYRLTSNLVVPNENTDGILIAAPSVSIDLAGFEIVRASCAGSTFICTPTSGSGSGVRPLDLGQGASVRNGSITGMGLHGVLLGVQAQVANVRVRWNRMTGIFVGEGSTVSGNTAYQNGGPGIAVTDDSMVSGNASAQNGSFGILAANGSTISGNTARSNGGSGIRCQQNNVVEGNTVGLNLAGGIEAGYLAHVVDNSLDGNAGTGIAASDGSSIIRNTVGAITPTFAGHPGITCGAGCAVFDNLVRNTSQAMTLGAGSRYGRNVLSLSPNPAVTGGGVSAQDNLCNGASC